MRPLEFPSSSFSPAPDPHPSGKKGNTKQISTPKLPSMLFEEPFSSHCLRCIVSPSQSSLLLSASASASSEDLVTTFGPFT